MTADCKLLGTSMSTVMVRVALLDETSVLPHFLILTLVSADCWMLAARDAHGNQVANPQKFPNGFKAVADFIHSLNMSSGLYTAKGPTTCAGFAASCQHEAQDALQWASWGIDYVKVRNHAAAPHRAQEGDKCEWKK